MTEVSKIAWQKRRFDFQGKRTRLDHDYALELLQKRREYSKAKVVLEERSIKFQSPLPARLRVFYNEATVIYNSADEAMADTAERGIPVMVLKETSSLLDQISHLTWRSGGKRQNR